MSRPRPSRPRNTRKPASPLQVGCGLEYRDPAANAFHGPGKATHRVQRLAPGRVAITAPQGVRAECAADVWITDHWRPVRPDNFFPKCEPFHTR
jgi:hypothetical protein